jgi:hypothetical protein
LARVQKSERDPADPALGDGLAELARLVEPACAGEAEFVVFAVDELTLPATFDPAAEFVLVTGDEFALTGPFDPVDEFVLPGLLDPALVFPAFELAFELANEPSRADEFLLLFAAV